MGDLVFLRELIRPTDSSRRNNDINHVFRLVKFASSPECVATRDTAPWPTVAIALFPRLRGAMSIKARVREAENVHTFSRWYARRFGALLHMDLSNEKSGAVRSAMGRVYLR